LSTTTERHNAAPEKGTTHYRYMILVQCFHTAAIKVIPFYHGSLKRNRSQTRTIWLSHSPCLYLGAAMESHSYLSTWITRTRSL